MANHSNVELPPRRSDRPRVLAHFAITADGKVSTAARTPSQFTSAQDKRRLLEIRALGDALLVGRSTAELDRMSMTLPDPALQEVRRSKGKTPEPLRVLLTRRGRLPADLPVLNRAGAPVLIYSTQQMDCSSMGELEGKATVYRQPGQAVDLRAMLRHLALAYQVESVVVEGGPTLLHDLARLDVVDEIYLTLAPILFGGYAAPTLTGVPAEFLPQTLRYEIAALEVGAGECYLRFQRSHASN